MKHNQNQKPSQENVMFQQVFTAAALSIGLAMPAVAEQFAVRLDGPYPGASAGLTEELKISVIDSFTANGAHYLILDAPSDAYIETFIYALHREAIELNALEVNWTAAALADLPLAKRLQFLRPVDCEFCTS